MLQFLQSKPLLTNELEPLISKKSKELKKNTTRTISYASLGVHFIWTVLFIILFTTQDSTVKVETRPVENNWWTFDETTKILTIHANVVEIGQPRELRSNKLLKATVSNRLIVHGDVKSSTVNIDSNLMLHGLPIENVLKQGPPGETGPSGSKGDTGAVGETGSKGATGETGPSGSKGDTGAVGETGSKGDTGAVGETGSKGDTGAVGETGSKGDTGAVGETGPSGSKGDTGAVGDTGPSGSKGDTGAVGDTGPSGSKGDTGAVGETGSKGDTGETGPSGSKGDTGAVGETGDSGENVWWTYDKEKHQLNLLTDVVDTGTIIAKNFHIKD